MTYKTKNECISEFITQDTPKNAAETNGITASQESSTSSGHASLLSPLRDMKLRCCRRFFTTDVSSHFHIS